MRWPTVTPPAQHAAEVQYNLNVLESELSFVDCCSFWRFKGAFSTYQTVSTNKCWIPVAIGLYSVLSLSHLCPIYITTLNSPMFLAVLAHQCPGLDRRFRTCTPWYSDKFSWWLRRSENESDNHRINSAEWQVSIPAPKQVSVIEPATSLLLAHLACIFLLQLQLLFYGNMP